MFFENDDELDYEEGDETLESKTQVTDGNARNKKNNDLSGSEDNFLQIDVNENEGLECPEKVTEEITDKRESKVKKTKPENEKGQGSKMNYVGSSVSAGKFYKKKYNFRKTHNKKSGCFYRQPQGWPNLFRGLDLTSRVPFLRYRFGNVPSKPLKYIKYQPPPSFRNRNFLKNQTNQLMNNEQQILSSFWSNPNFLHQTNLMNLQKNLLQFETLYPTISPTTQPALQPPLDWPLPSVQGKTDIETVQPLWNHSTNDTTKTSIFTLKNDKKKNPFDQTQPKLGTPSNTLSSLRGMENFNQPNPDLLKTAYNVWQESEKEKLKVLKEERLKRFMNDNKNTGANIFKNSSKDTESSSFETISLNLLAQKNKFHQTSYLREINKGISSQCSKGNPGNSQIKKPILSKESLIKKKNPFESSELTLTNIKKEKVDEFETENFEITNLPQLSSTRSATKMTNQNNVLNLDYGNHLKSANRENGNNSNVTFVRTISKSFEELGLSKTVLENSAHFNQHSAALVHEESLLTGCIVKVFNIPKTTTTNDVLELCNPIGRVLEIKLNLPKENSAVIRFAKSEYADNFYSLYHGQKYCDNFLNVVIV